MIFDASNYLPLQVHGGAGHGHEGGIIALLNDFLLFLDGLSGKSSSDMFAALLPGIAGMDNFHPLVVHFPIALLTLFLIIELGVIISNSVSWRIFASGLLYTGTLAAMTAAYFGLRAAETVAHDDQVHAIMERHEGIGLTIAGIALILSIWRWFLVKDHKTVMQPVFLLLAAVMNLLLFFGADLGGLMVYQHGVSVKAVLPSISSYQHQHAGDVGHNHQHGTDVVANHGHHHHDGAEDDHVDQPPAVEAYTFDPKAAEQHLQAIEAAKQARQSAR